MILELGKAFSFFATLISLYSVAVAAFFEPATRWDERIMLSLPRLAIAACICLVSALLFTWPARSNPDRHQPLLETLPMRVFLSAVAAMVLLFVADWYILCGGPGPCANAYHNCG